VSIGASRGEGRHSSIVRRSWSHVARVGLLLYIGFMAAGCGSTASSPAASTSTLSTQGGHVTTATRVAHVGPVTTQGVLNPGYSVKKTVHGTCEAGSDAVAGGLIYRCSSGNSLYDPCWSARPPIGDAGAVACLAEPWSSSVVEIVTSRLPTETVTQNDLSYPWGVMLTNGDRCLALQGSHDLDGNLVVNFACGTLSRLVGNADRSSPLWTYESATFDNKSDQYVNGPIVDVRVAWYGAS
jgi:hypothetical protein